MERPVVSSQFLWNALYNYRGEQPAVVARPCRPPWRGDRRVPRELPGFQGKGLGLGCLGTTRKVALLPFLLWR